MRISMGIAFKNDASTAQKMVLNLDRNLFASGHSSNELELRQEISMTGHLQEY